MAARLEVASESAPSRVDISDKALSFSKSESAKSDSSSAILSSFPESSPAQPESIELRNSMTITADLTLMKLLIARDY